MNKFLTKIATAFVGMTMAIGVGVAVVAGQEAVAVDAKREPVTSTISQTYGTGSPYQWTDSTNNITYTGTSGNGGTSYYHLKQNDKVVTSTITMDLSMPVTVTVGAGTYGGVSTQKVVVKLKSGNSYIATGKTGDNNDEYFTPSGTSKSLATFTLVPTSDANKVNKDVVVEISCSTTNAGKYIRLYSIEMNYYVKNLTVTYNANGATDGSVPVDSKKYAEGDSVSTADNSGNLSKTNFTFKGWNTKADPTADGAIHYDANTSNAFTMGETSVVLYAEWETNDPVITIVSDNGVIYGKIGDDITVEIEKFNDTGLNVYWDLIEDDDSIVVWTESTTNVHFNKTGKNAILYVALLDSNENAVAEDMVYLSTLVPNIDIKYNDVSADEYDLFVGDSDSFVAVLTNAPNESNVIWESDSEKLTINENTGLFNAISTGTAITVTASLVYDENVLVYDFVEVTINQLLTPKLLLKYDNSTEKRSFVYGNDLDMSKVSAVYTSDRGINSEVENLGEYSFTSLDFIGTKAFTISYNNLTSNAINITVTNVGSKDSKETISETELNDGGYASNLSENVEKSFSLSSSLTNVTSFTAKLVIQCNTNGSGTWNHGITFKAYNGSTAVASQLVYVAVSGGGALNTFTYTFTFDEPVTITKASYNFTNKVSGSNIKAGKFTYAGVTNDFDYINHQAAAFANYFLEQTAGYCSGTEESKTIVPDTLTELKTQYDNMCEDAQKVFKTASVVRGKGASYTNAVSQALSRYVNMQEDRFYNDFLGLNLNLSNLSHNPLTNTIGGLTSFEESNSGIILLIIVSFLGVTAVAGYFLIKRRKEN